MLSAFLSTSVSPYKGPRNLQTSEPTKTSFRVTWDPAPGDVRGYKVTFHPAEDDVDLRELMVSQYDNTVVLEELRCVLSSFPFSVISLHCNLLWNKHKRQFLSPLVLQSRNQIHSERVRYV